MHVWLALNLQILLLLFVCSSWKVRVITLLPFCKFHGQTFHLWIPSLESSQKMCLWIILMSFSLYSKQHWSSFGHYIPSNTSSICLFLFIVKNLKRVTYTSCFHFFSSQFLPMPRIWLCFHQIICHKWFFLDFSAQSLLFILFDFQVAWNGIFFPIWHLLFPDTLAQLFPSPSPFLTSHLWPSQLWCCYSSPHLFSICTYLLHDPI